MSPKISSFVVICLVLGSVIIWRYVSGVTASEEIHPKIVRPTFLNSFPTDDLPLLITENKRHIEKHGPNTLSRLHRDFVTNNTITLVCIFRKDGPSHETHHLWRLESSLASPNDPYWDIQETVSVSKLGPHDLTVTSQCLRERNMWYCVSQVQFTHGSQLTIQAIWESGSTFNRSAEAEITGTGEFANIKGWAQANMNMSAHLLRGWKLLPFHKEPEGKILLISSITYRIHLV